MNDIPNMKPADELYEIRNRIKGLKARETQLANNIKTGQDDEQGDFAFAIVSTRKSNHFDRKAAEEELGDLSRFEVQRETKVISVKLHQTETGA